MKPVPMRKRWPWRRPTLPAWAVLDEADQKLLLQGLIVALGFLVSCLVVGLSLGLGAGLAIRMFLWMSGVGS